MFTLPICFATLPPSRPPSASPTAPVAFAESEPVTFSVPVSGVASDSTSWAPVAEIGDAVLIVVRVGTAVGVLEPVLKTEILVLDDVGSSKALLKVASL